MQTSRLSPVVGYALLCTLLGVLAATVGLGAFGWVVGLGGGAVLTVSVVLGLAAHGREALGPADLVTLSRALLGCAVAALVADSFVSAPATAVLVPMAAVALALDAVDGRVARATRTGSPFGAKLDGEVDAFLIAVLCVYVAPTFGWWVLTMGAARYAFGAAAWWLPWMRAERLPFRYWRKVVTATAGVVLLVAAADVLPRPVTYAGLWLGLGLLAETFGRDVWWLWRRRDHVHKEEHGADGPRPPSRRRQVASMTLTVLGGLLVWFALLAPDQAYRLGPASFLRLPVEGLLVAALALVLPARGRRILAVVVGLLLAVLTLFKVLDMGFFAFFDRPFDVVGDSGYLGPGIAILDDSVGRAAAVLVVVAAVLLLVVLLVGLPLSVARLTGLMARHRVVSLRVVAALLVVWALSAAAGLQVRPGEPLASVSASRLAVTHVEAVAHDAEEQERFDAAVSKDRFRERPGGDLLSGLRGKDVLLVFVESYGRVALQGSPGASRLHAQLDAESRRLDAAGYSSASAFLTSSTFGGLSWLAHGTLQSGLWVDNQSRYDELMAGNRLTLGRAFGQAGWRTVAFTPSGGHTWPEGERFYQLDKVYGRWGVGYHGPRFGFSKMPDQFALEAVHRLELAKSARPPVMAEIDLASSHEPWAKIPRMVPWSTLGDGTRFERMAKQVEIPVHELWADRDDVRAAYAQSIRYSLHALYSWLQRYGDDDTVMVVLGDHQPGTVITGHGASRDVPVTVVAHDPAVVRQISGWGWQPGLRPDAGAPVWRMDAFRDRFFSAFSGAR
ncbi:MAG: CDP-alcohol phosphatidyltransferase family protein [Nocardioidaceae bacterium]|nr:CDP-alcohol phosphatidyltransferase family protein [Nocardioidaceae bacterium]